MTSPPIPFTQPLYVTRPMLLPLGEYTALLQEVWDSGWLANGGEQHPGLRFATLVHPRAWFVEQVSVGPGAHLAGAVTVGNDADIGAGVTIRPAIRLGAGVVIGAGAAVVHDLPAGCAAVGVPARSIPKPRVP